MRKVQFSVVVDESHVNLTDEIAGKLTEQGFDVEEVAPEIGTIYGSADEGLAPQLRTIQGIEEIRPEETVDLPPFSAKVPQ